MASQKFDAVVATPRTGKFNKNHARRVRVEGKIPAVVYGAGLDVGRRHGRPARSSPRSCTRSPATTPSST